MSSKNVVLHVNVLNVVLKVQYISNSVRSDQIRKKIILIST